MAKEMDVFDPGKTQLLLCMLRLIILHQLE